MSNVYGSAVNDPDVQPRAIIDFAEKGGKLRVITSHVVVLATHTSTDLFIMAKVPSWAVIDPESTIFHDATDTGVTMDFGDAKNPDGLIDGGDVAAAGSISAIAAIGIEKYHKRLWELLGYTEDPNRELDLYFTVSAAPAADCDVVLKLKYVVD